MQNYAELFTQAQTATASKGSGTRSGTPQIKFESDANGRPRVSFNTAIKRRFIKEGTLNRYAQFSFLDQRKNGNGKILVFFTFTNEANGAVSISNAVDTNGQVMKNNISYINSLSSLCNSVDLDPQELYSVVSSDEVVRIDDNKSTYVVSIVGKSEQELNELIAQDEAKVQEHKDRQAQAKENADDESTED